MLLLKNISKLCGVLDGGKGPLSGAAMADAGVIENAWLLIDGERIADYGPMARDFSDDSASAECDIETVDACGAMVMPSFCDPHTHIVWAGSREGEFIDKINGLTYEQIAARGGGILNSADRLHELTENQLYEESMERVREIMYKGTGAVEIKSGYGLTLEDELKMLRVIRMISETTPMAVRATFLGAHAVGRAYAGRQSEYVDHICRDMLPAVAAEGLADFVDVFCDRGFFTTAETEKILNAASKYGLVPKIHANELDADWGGVQVGVRCGALSVDHLEMSGEREIECLRGSATIPTVLPGASFFLGMPFAPARGMADAGLPVALASDYNPGSSPSGDMRFVMALGCIKLRLRPEEAFRAVTINSAAAMGLADDYGSITRGKVANLIVTRPEISSLATPAYHYTSPFIDHIYLRGRLIES